MGTPEEDRDWVDVANDLLSKCHITLRLRKLPECDAGVFLALYQAIFGEQVPDFITTPGSQEDDIHNVQSVIDSLALDYLQISLSHITGENIVRGDAESVKNLLEIFDGLLEYLTEQIGEEEETQNGESNGHGLGHVHRSGPVSTEVEDQEKAAMLDKAAMLESASQSSSIHSAVPSSRHSLHSWNAEETGSTNELIRLGDSARTFSAKQEAAVEPLPLRGALDSPLDPQAALLREPLRSAIPLQPPFQTTPHRPGRAPPSGSHAPGASAEEAAPPPLAVECPRPAADTVVINGRHSPGIRSPVESDTSASSQPRTGPQVLREELERPGGGGPRRVLFRPEPDVLLLSLQEEGGEEEEEEEEQEEGGRGLTRCSHRERRGLRQTRQTQHELHHMSEKLSRRLEELDQMLKQALGQSAGSEVGEVREEDKESHHSDSAMETRTQGPTGPPRAPPAPRARSLSPSPPRARRSLSSQLDDAARGAESDDEQRRGSAPNATEQRRGPAPNAAAANARPRRPGLRHGKHSQLVEQAYEEELQRYEDRERLSIAKERLRAQEAEREYREAILKDVPRTLKSPAKRPTPQHRSPRLRQPTPGRRRQENVRKAPPMKVKESELLPALLEEFPGLRLSPHALGHMWRRQLDQVDRLHAPAAEHRPARSTRTGQVEEAQRRHDLLVEIIHKEHEHNRRLRDFKERIVQQRSAQSALREQRQQVARARKYHSELHVQLRARMMRDRTREERMFRQVFEEGLALQRARLREQRAHAKEQRHDNQQRHRDQITSMENYYKDQFSLLAETLAQERQEIQVRKKAQEKALHKMKRELRSRMEREIGELQRIIVQNDEEDYFRDLEVERLRGRVQTASFQYNTSCLH